MSRIKRKTLVIFSIIGLFAFSGLALAASEEKDDTIFNFGYLSGEQFFLWNYSSIDYEADTPLTLEELAELCSLDGATLSYTTAEDGTVGLAEGQEDLDEACGELMGGQVTGPNGQVNHGMFMKLFNSLYSGPGRGCLVRHLAQSTLGTDDQQIVVPEADPELELTGEGEVELTGVETDCVHGKKATDGGDDDGPGNSAAAKEKWGDDGPGKSGAAPGRNK